MIRRRVARRRDGTYQLHLAEAEQELLSSLVDQLDPLLDDPSADPGLRRLFPPARTDDLLAEAQWEIEHGPGLRDARRAALDVVRAPASGPLSEDQVIAWVQGINALRLVLAERLGVDGDEQGEDDAYERALARASDPDLDPAAREEAVRALQRWHAYELLAVLIAHAVRALD